MQNLSDDLLVVPTFKQVGLPEIFGRFGKLDSKIKAGQWVNRGDVLLTLHYHFYQNERKIRFFPDPQHTMIETLYSPVSGLVIDFQSENLRDWLGGTHFTGFNAWPIIRLPKNEPPQNSDCLSFYRLIGAILRNSDGWRKLHYYHEEKGETRYGDLIKGHEHEHPYRSAIQELIDSYHLKLKQFEIRKQVS